MRNFLSALALLLGLSLLSTGCGDSNEPSGNDTDTTSTVSQDGDFEYQTEQFADLRILRYQVPGFEELPLRQKKLLYYLYEAALSGRDIIYDQNYKHNLLVRRSLENIVESYQGERSGEEWEKFMTYVKRVWFSNGIHHHYSSKKIMPEFSKEYFMKLMAESQDEGFPQVEGMTNEDLSAELADIIFNPDRDVKRVNKDEGVDLIAESANNYYEGVSQSEVESYYDKMSEGAGDNPPSFGLNSKLVKENGEVMEKTYKVGGMYGPAIEKIVYWLEKAKGVAENEKQAETIGKLIEYYKTGDLAAFDAYNIAWVEDTESDIDFINGFIEVYGDAKGYRGAYESVVQLRDPVASKRIDAISKEAQWFEDNSPLMEEHKKEDVKGISARVINVVMEAGDASPSTPIGINLPNSNWIRTQHGSKSVNLANIVQAYDESSKSSGVLEEFAWDEAEIKRAREHGALASNLHTDMHEVIGHASGKLNPGVGQPHATLKNYASTLEEARADLVALYYLMDQKLIDIGVMESLETGKAEYDSYIRNGMMLQLRRLDLGENIEEDHMRNRQLVAKWAYEKGKDENVIEKKQRDGKTYFVINDYEKLRELFGQLLREIQRIKSEGDYAAAKKLVETYGVKVDQDIHKEVLSRVESLNIAPYAGFINPKLVPVTDGNGEITDIKIEYPSDFTKQHMEYSKDHSYLPTYN